MDDFIRRAESAQRFRESTHYVFDELIVSTHPSESGVEFSVPLFGAVVSRDRVRELADLLYKIAEEV